MTDKLRQNENNGGIESKTAQEVFDAAINVYSDKHNHAFSSLCDLGELADFTERLRNELGVESPEAEFVTDEVLADIEKDLRIIVSETPKAVLEQFRIVIT